MERSTIARELDKWVTEEMDDGQCYESHHEIMVFRPTWSEFSDMPKYISYMESKNAHLAGVAKVNISFFRLSTSVSPQTDVSAYELSLFCYSTFYPLSSCVYISPPR